MRTSLGVQEWVFWLMAFGSAALTFVVRGPRLLWAVLLAAICGVCEARTISYDHMPEKSPARPVDWLLLLAPLVFGAGYAWPLTSAVSGASWCSRAVRRAGTATPQRSGGVGGGRRPALVRRRERPRQGPL